MFNIFEGSKDEKARKLQERLEMLRQMREDGQFDSEPIKKEEQPEIVADGHGPDDTSRPSPLVKHEEVANPNPGGSTAVLPSEAPPVYTYQPQQPCNNCAKETRHVTYGMGTPTWHCVICCTCDWCLETVERQETGGFRPAPLSDEGLDRVREQFKRSRKALVEAVAAGQGLFFCTKCGAGLRCSVCNNEATGNHCDLCGKVIGPEGFCMKCWKEAD